MRLGARREIYMNVRKRIIRECAAGLATNRAKLQRTERILTIGSLGQMYNPSYGGDFVSNSEPA